MEERRESPDCVHCPSVAISGDLPPEGLRGRVQLLGVSYSTAVHLLNTHTYTHIHHISFTYIDATYTCAHHMYTPNIYT